MQMLIQISLRPLIACVSFSNGNVWQQEIKQGFCAQKQAGVVAKNLRVMMEGGKEHWMGKYSPQLSLAMVSLGRKDAVAQLPGLTIIGRAPGLIKSGDLFVSRTRKQMGV